MRAYIDKYRPKVGKPEFSIHCLNKTQIRLIESALESNYPENKTKTLNQEEADDIIALKKAFLFHKNETGQ